MNQQDYEEVKGKLSEDYILLSRGKVWSAIGGFFGVLVVTGLVSYSAAMEAIEKSVAQEAVSEILRLKSEARLNSLAITNLLDQVPDLIRTVTVNVSGEVVVDGKLVAEHVVALSVLENQGPQTHLLGGNDLGEHYLLGGLERNPIAIGPEKIAIGNSGKRRNLWVSGGRCTGC